MHHHTDHNFYYLSVDIKTAIHHYCNYQPRCHAEVRNKLYELGCTTPEVEENIAELIEAGLLNEEKFARAYARGKFRIKHWGRQKIISQLRLKKISEYCIKKGLSEIDADEYEQTLERLGTNKWDELKKERSQGMKQMKVYRYLMQKGYESDLARDLINRLIGK